jgi:hypothetical protein
VYTANSYFFDSFTCADELASFGTDEYSPQQKWVQFAINLGLDDTMFMETNR